jgi:hypothetical protein
MYEQLQALPEGLTGEILNGQIYTQPRPSGPHSRVSVAVVQVPPFSELDLRLAAL